MDTYQLSLTAYLWRLENGLILTESPSFPELCCAASSGRQALNKLKRATRKVAQQLACDELVRRQSVGEIQTDRLRLSIEPPV